MPFIRGRYHINPIAGEALEAAREAEAALLAIQHAAQANAGEEDADGAASAESNAPTRVPTGVAKGPIHHIEIEAAELVPSHSGRASRGFVARVHRTIAARDTDDSNGRAALHALAHPAAHQDDQADGFADSPASTTWSAPGPQSAALDFLTHVANAAAQHSPSGPTRATTGVAARGVATHGSSNGIAAPETHVFADHRDLVAFLSDLLAHDGER
jgi:hypothetical protein